VITVKFAECLGLNNYLDSASIFYDAQTGKYECSEASNLFIDHGGMVFRRPGYATLNDTPLTALWSDNVQAYAVGRDTNALYRVEPDCVTLTPLRTGLSPNTWMRFTKAMGRVFYTNGVEKGSIINGQDVGWGYDRSFALFNNTLTWEAILEAHRPNSVRPITEPPVGHIVEYFAGRIWIAVDNILYYTEPTGNFDFFCAADGFLPDFPSRIRMVRGIPGIRMFVPGGLYVGTDDGVYFCHGKDPEQMNYKQVSAFPPYEGTDLYFDGGLMSPPLQPEQACIWTSSRAVSVGTSEGEVRELTYKKLVYPAASRGSACIVDNKYICLLQP